MSTLGRLEDMMLSHSWSLGKNLDICSDYSRLPLVAPSFGDRPAHLPVRAGRCLFGHSLADHRQITLTKRLPCPFVQLYQVSIRQDLL
jgi:hypothetical protein